MKRIAAGALLFLIAAFLGTAVANQSNTWSPTTGTVSGLQLTTNYNNAFTAIQSCNSGAAAPTNDQSGFPVQGQCWLNTSSSPPIVQRYDGTSWVTIGWLDTTNHQWIANSAGGTGTLPSSSTTDLGSLQNSVISISGTTTITSFGSSALPGAVKFLNFTGALTLTNSVTLILPNGGSNITTANGDTAVAAYTGGTTWRVLSYTRTAGLGSGSITPSQLALSAVAQGTPMLNGTLKTSVAGNAMTIAVKTLAGTDPTSIDPAYFLVPNTTGGYSVIQQTSALSIVVPSGATLGTVNAQPNRVWVGVVNNAGTPVLAVYNSLSGFGIKSWDETSQPTTTNISGTSTNPQVWYGSSGVTGGLRVIGFVESTQSTAGQWSATPGKTALFGPGVKRPGEQVQEVNPGIISTGDTTTNTTFTAFTNNQVSITPTSGANLVRVEAMALLTGTWQPWASSVSQSAVSQVQISRGTSNGSGLIGTPTSLTNQMNSGTGNPSGIIWGDAVLFAYDVPGGSTTYAVQGKMNSTASGTLTYGGNSLMLAREIQI